VDPTVITNPSVIAASTQPGIAGNDINALALLNVQQQTVVTDGQSAATIGDFYSNVTESLGGAAQQVNTNMTSQQQLVQHLTNQKQSVVGVNLDEEAAKLVALQHAYQAAARAITTQDSMLDTIINGMGLVGRA
jgi:flagellar hook-associated protein 1